ncbi:MAG: hypothetical protein ABFD97_07475 [Syntrophobacter sp.]
MIIGKDILERACKDMIETILFCLRSATKGTIYRIGPMPRLQAVRITSGIRNEVNGTIEWGLPEVSDYNHPGKSWEQYRDRPGYVREAMAWCVEKGKSWTADDPNQDARSVRKQLSDEPEDHHHMEPVLIKKSYLYHDSTGDLQYPLDYSGNPIWKDWEYVVVAVVKIHFKPGTIKMGDYSTKVIKKLSRILGTELLSLHVRETLSKAQKELARQRLQSCNVLAHELRNTLIKLGFIFSAINAEISFLREQWESEIARAFPHIESKRDILNRLSEIIRTSLPGINGAPMLAAFCQTLLLEQEELAGLSLMPGLGERWVDNKIRPKWNRLLLESKVWDSCREEIQSLLDRLPKALWVGTNQELTKEIRHLPEDLKNAWPRLAYTDFTVDKVLVLDEILKLLDHPDLSIPHKQQTKKVLTALKALVEMIPEVEERANRIILSLKNGESVDCSEFPPG